MGMTMTQKILAAHAGLDHVVAGQLIEAKLDMVLGNDVTSPVAINEMNKFGKDGVFDKTRIALVMYHFTPNKDIQSAQNCKQVVLLPVPTALPTILMWAIWELSTRCCRSRGLWPAVTA